jgi:hypothetical protein
MRTGDFSGDRGQRPGVPSGVAEAVLLYSSGESRDTTDRGHADARGGSSDCCSNARDDRDGGRGRHDRDGGRMAMTMVSVTMTSMVSAMTMAAMPMTGERDRLKDHRCRNGHSESQFAKHWRYLPEG